MTHTKAIKREIVKAVPGAEVFFFMRTGGKLILHVEHPAMDDQVEILKLSEWISETGELKQKARRFIRALAESSREAVKGLA